MPKTSAKQKYIGFLAFLVVFFSSIFSQQLIACVRDNPQVKAFGDYYQQLMPEKEFRATALDVVASLTSAHYKEVSLNDRLSQEVFSKFFDDLDPMRMFFTQIDIDGQQKHSEKIDDYLRRGDTKAFYEIYNIYASKAINRYIKIIAQIDSEYDFDFDKEEFIQVDRSQESWARNETELNDLWRKRVKNSWLSLKLAGKDKKEISSLLRKRYINSLNQLGQVNNRDVFEIAINAYASLFDPHTQYFSPINTENFKIRMNQSLEGIGALLKKKEEYTEIVRLITAGPADKSKQLKAGDRVIGVGQGEDGEMVDIIGCRLDDVVQMIRGEKGSIVRLNILSSQDDSIDTAKVVNILRDKVVLEEQVAKKKVIKVNQGDRTLNIGVIEIPMFYADYDAYQKGDPNYRTTTRDVKRLISELKKDGIDGLVIDLRDNGGGFLTEANSLVGLFIKSGPVVLEKNANSQVSFYADQDPRIYYDGPLTVLVNRLSASASEIFAGAIQDYRRGIVVGVQTFGKGTVQRVIPLRSGQLKYTHSKYYRVSGGSTQHRGVIPDISFPALYDVSEIGESSLEYAMPWDSIPAARYSLFQGFERYVPELIKRHSARMKATPELIFLTDQLEMLEKAREKTQISINKSIRKKEREDLKKDQLAIENKKRKSLGQELLTKLDDEELNEEDSEPEKNADEDKPDALLEEATKVMADLIELTDVANAKVAHRFDK